MLAREFEIAFPEELNQQQREKLLDELCNMIVEKHHVVVDAAIHAPHTQNGSDSRNYHAHIMFTTRAIDARTGLFSAKKYREFSRDHGTQTVQDWRADFAELTNKYLFENGYNVTVDHRSYADKNCGLQATQHEGPKATALRRKCQNNHSIQLPAICQKNDQIKNSNAEKIKARSELALLDHEIEVSESLLAHTNKEQRIQQAEIRAKSFQKKYLDIAHLVETKNTFTEKQAVIEQTEAYALAKQYVLDFKLLQSVNKAPRPKKQTLWNKIIGTQPDVFYSLESVERHISDTGFFNKVSQEAKKEAAAEAERKLQLQTQLEAERQRQTQREKQTRFERFLLKTQHEVDQLDLKLKADLSREFAEQIERLNRGEIKEVNIIHTDEVLELHEFIVEYNTVKTGQKARLSDKHTASLRLDAELIQEPKAQQQVKKTNVQAPSNQPIYYPEQAIKPKKPAQKQNNNDGPSI